MTRQRRRLHRAPEPSGRGALLSSIAALGLLLAYQCSDDEASSSRLMEQLITPSALSLPKSASKSAPESAPESSPTPSLERGE